MRSSVSYYHIYVLSRQAGMVFFLVLNIGVLLLLYVCSLEAGKVYVIGGIVDRTVSKGLSLQESAGHIYYICVRITLNVSSYHYICVRIPLYICPHTNICVRIQLNVSSYYICRHTTIYVCSGRGGAEATRSPRCASLIEP